MGYSILNRVAHPSWWGMTVPSVVAKPLQYSSLTAGGDANLTLYPTGYTSDWFQCLQVGFDVVDGKVQNPVPDADSYYATSMKTPPDWADPVIFKKRTGKDLIFVGQIGHHRFYNTDGRHPENVKGVV